jgi:hypothetical protein
MVCKEWHDNPLINPRTGRAIKYMGPTYMSLLRECGQERAQTKPQPQPPKYDLYIVFGAGCTQKDVDMYEKLIASRTITNTYNKIKVYCDTKLFRIVKDIAKAYCFLAPSKDSDFVKQVYNDVDNSLKQHNKVILIGFSYGGSIVTSVAKLMNNHQFASNLQAATCGAIHTTSLKKTNNMAFRQYMYLDDVALKCAKHKQPKLTIQEKYRYDPVSNITWLKHSIDKKNKWIIHASYEFVSNDIIYYKDIHKPLQTYDPEDVTYP